jgi:hypothetical protein
VFRGDRAKDAELLVLRHENAVLRRRAGRVRYAPAERVWFAALTRRLGQAGSAGPHPPPARHERRIDPDGEPVTGAP